MRPEIVISQEVASRIQREHSIRQDVFNACLEDSKICQLMNDNSNRENIIESIKLLQDEEDPLTAVKEVARAISENKIKVFLSYKMCEQETADVVVSVLRGLSAGKISIKYAKDFDPGIEFHREIRRAIKDAHWFILLLPSPSEDWDWCLYETGLFRAKIVSEKVNRLIVLHHPEISLPEQAREFLAVKADEKSIESFLRKILVKKNVLPGMPVINPESEILITDSAVKIYNAINEPIKFHKLNPCVILEVESPESLENPEQLEKATIRRKLDTNTLKTFGFHESPETWGGLISRLKQNRSDLHCLNGLCKSIRAASMGHDPPPVEGLFELVDGGRFYQPSLNAIQTGKGIKNRIFEIIFVEDVTARSRGHLLPEIQALATYLTFAYRFRIEVVTRFIKKNMSEDEIQLLEDGLGRIEAEARSRGEFSLDLLCSNFGSEQESQIRTIVKEWRKFRNVDKNGDLDTAIANREQDKIQHALRLLSSMNKQFLELIQKKFEELVINPSHNA